jgi:hypothetical protein
MNLLRQQVTFSEKKHVILQKFDIYNKNNDLPLAYLLFLEMKKVSDLHGRPLSCQSEGCGTICTTQRGRGASGGGGEGGNIPGDL